MDQKDKIFKLIQYLTSQISLGWNYFVVFNYIDQAFRQNRIKGAHSILKNAQLACWDCAILAFAKVIIANDDSLNIHYMFNCIEHNLDIYRSIIQGESRNEDLKKQIEQHRKNLNEICHSLPLSRLLEERDRIVAHLDKRLVNNPDRLFSTPQLDVDKFRSAFLTLREILRTYDTQVTSFSLWLDDSKSINQELNYLISLTMSH